MFLGATLFFFLALPAFGQANQFRRFEIGWNLISYTRMDGNNFAGGDLSFAFHKSDRLAFVANASVYENFDLVFSDEELTLYSFGPRYTRSHGKRWMFFLQGLAGGAHLTDKEHLILGPPTVTIEQSANGFSLAAGGGIDLGLKPWIALRLVQADYSFVNFGSLDIHSNTGKVGFGVVFRFGKKD
jgi:hypothetical protein